MRSDAPLLQAGLLLAPLLLAPSVQAQDTAQDTAEVTPAEGPAAASEGTSPQPGEDPAVAELLQDPPAADPGVRVPERDANGPLSGGDPGSGDELVDPRLGTVGDTVQGPVIELGLEAVLTLALERNFDLQKARLDTQVAIYNALGSWGDFEWNFTGFARYADDEIPSSSTLAGAPVISNQDTTLNLDLRRALTTGGSFGANFNTNKQETNNQFAFAPELNRSVLQLTYTQPLMRGAWRDYATSTQQEAELNRYVAEEAQRQSRHLVLFNAQNAYWDLVAAEEQRGVAASSLELGLELLEKRQRELEAGVGTEVEVLQSRAEVATRIETLLQAENDVAQRMDALKLLILDQDDPDLWDRPVRTTTGLPDEVSVVGLPTWTEALLTATSMRSELRQDRLRVDIAQLRKRRTASERLSGLDLELGAGSDGVSTSFNDALDDVIGVEYPGWSVQLTYSMPLGNKRAANADRAAQANVRRAVLDFEQRELTVLSEVRKAVRDVYFRAEAVRAAEQSLRLAERQLEAEQARYEEGLSTNFQVLEFQRDLVAAASTERQARVEYMKSRVALRNAQGLMDEDVTP